jgi:uncharacterized protein (TIGR00288 family)
MENDERQIAVFIDFENVAMGVRESNYGNFDIDLVLKRVVEKGKILFKRAYSDWHRYTEFKRAFHQAAIELVDVPQTRYSGKNSADIRMVVDALDLSYQKDHIDTFVIVSGDSDFSPLVSKLRENGRYVIGVGVKKSSSDLLVNNCDEFIYYEDLVRPTSRAAIEEPKLRNLPVKRAEALRLVMETFEVLQREGKEVIYGSMIKQTLLRKLPSFNESYYGYPMFSRLLEDAAENKLLRLTKDMKSGGYILNPYAEAPGAPAVSAVPTNGDSARTVAPEPAQAEAALAPTVSAGEPREWNRHTRWGRGRIRGPQRPPEAAQAARKPHAPPSPVLSAAPPPEPAEGQALPPAGPAEEHFVPEVASATESEISSVSQPEAATSPVEAPVAVPAEKKIHPGKHGRRFRWGQRGKAAGQQPAKPPEQATLNLIHGLETLPHAEPPVAHSADSKPLEPDEFQPKPKEEQALPAVEISEPSPPAIAGLAQASAAVEAQAERSSKSKRTRVSAQRAGSKMPILKKAGPRKPTREN